MAKIVPSERLRRELDEVLAGVGECDDPVEAVARVGARLIMQQALEDEVTEFLGRERYQRAGDGGGAIYRIGYEPRVVKTTSGPMGLERPRVRNAAELGSESRVLGKGVARPPARAGGADHRRVPAGPIGPRRRSAARRDLRRASRRQIDRRPDLSGHPRALPRVVRAATGRA